MKNLYFTEILDVQFFLDENKKLIACWCCNDASYMHEYMQKLFDHLGYKVIREKPSNVINETKPRLLSFGYSDTDILIFNASE